MGGNRILENLASLPVFCGIYLRGSMRFRLAVVT